MVPTKNHCYKFRVIWKVYSRLVFSYVYTTLIFHWNPSISFWLTNTMTRLFKNLNLFSPPKCNCYKCTCPMRKLQQGVGLQMVTFVIMLWINIIVYTRTLKLRTDCVSFYESVNICLHIFIMKNFYIPNMILKRRFQFVRTCFSN